MDRLKEFDTTSTITIINMLSSAEQTGQQEIVNICAYELTCRIYIPNEHTTFTQMLKSFGYKSLVLEEQNINKKIK